MCLIGVAWRTHPKWDLVLMANRDEFHQRPSAAAAPWKDDPQVFGGRDGTQGGSWLAVSTRGRLAAITNVRRMVPSDPQAPSRGGLVAEFVKGDLSAAAYAEGLAERAENYSGFNLLLYDGVELRYVTNHPQFTTQVLAPGVHAVSNASLDAPWPKSLRVRAALEAWTKDRWESFTPLFKTLADRTPAPPAELPNTGVGPALEKMLSAPFIVSPHYGTRCSTLVAVGGGAITFHEKRFQPSGVESGHTEQRLVLEKGV